jgi:hypothetical protein
MAVVVLVAGSLSLLPALAGAATPGGTPARQSAAPAAAAPTAPSPSAPPPRLSPYTIAARRHAKAAGGAVHGPAIPPSARRTRQPIGQVQH